MKKESFIILLLLFFTTTIFVYGQKDNLEQTPPQIEYSQKEYWEKTTAERKLGSVLFILYQETTGAEKPVHWELVLKNPEPDFILNEEDEIEIYVCLGPGGSSDIVMDLIKSLGGEVITGGSYSSRLVCYIHPSKVLQLAESFHVGSLEPVSRGINN